jgi:hypothetical protein
MTLRKLDRSGGANEASGRISVTSSDSVSCVRTVLMVTSVLPAALLVVPRSTDLSRGVPVTLPDLPDPHD